MAIAIELLAKRRYIAYSGGLESGTIVWEREWESLAALEAAYDHADKSDENKALSSEADRVFEDFHTEIYMVWNLP